MNADLLSALREKDPELWERMRRMPVYVHQDGQLTIDLTKSDNTELVASWLQHCLQEAIRARGWHISQSVMCWGREQPYYAAIRKSEYEPWAGETGDTEAEALMRAYLSALSGERI